jgi:hypothetical protein
LRPEREDIFRFKNPVVKLRGYQSVKSLGILGKLLSFKEPKFFSLNHTEASIAEY